MPGRRTSVEIHSSAIVSVRSTVVRSTVVRLSGLSVLWLILVASEPLTSPILLPLKNMQSKIPVVYVPGSTGTELRDRKTMELAWGRGRQLMQPRDDGYSLVHPIHRAPDSGESHLEPTRAIEKISLARLFNQEVYGPIIRMLEANNFQRGDLADPKPTDTAFLFAYDWRLDHRLAAVRLLEQLEKLRRVRGEERLTVDLICQSNGAYVCRYLMKYGGATLDQAEAGEAQPPAQMNFRKVVLLGNSNGGSLRILREIHRGRIYIDFIGRKLQPEVLFSLPALYQDLPFVRRDLFIDVEGKSLDIDVFDAEAWRRYGWGVFAPATRDRLERKGRADLFGNEQQQMRFLRKVLRYSQRFHRLLQRDVDGFGDTRFYLVQSHSVDTPERAVLVKKRAGWDILFTGDRKLARMGKLHQLATAKGDGHGTIESQLWLSPQESAALAAEPFYVDYEHFALILQPETHQRILEHLLDSATGSINE